MRILMASLGTRGDVEPFVHVSGALAARGHSVTLALDAGFYDSLPLSPEVQREALGFYTKEDHIRIVAHAFSAPTVALRTHWAFTSFFINRREALRARLDQLMPHYDLAVLPACLLFPTVNEGSIRPRWSTPTTVTLVTPALAHEYSEMAAMPYLRLAALSEELAPPSAIRSGWRFTGFWRERASGPLPDVVETFLAAGRPPMFLGMGSAVGFSTELGSVFLEAARRAGARVILERGWARIEGSAADVLTVDEVPFASLFPRCAAVFSHGGTGRVAETMHAGVPLAILPIVSDQIAWHVELEQRGLCLGQCDPFAPDVSLLADLISRALHDDALRAAAQAIAARLALEDGVFAACDAIEQHVTSS